MVIKTLENYFDHWIHVDYPVQGNSTSIFANGTPEVCCAWCSENIGQRDLHWMMNASLKSMPRGSPAMWTITFRFLNSEDAMMFILRWGGEVVTKQ